MHLHTTKRKYKNKVYKHGKIVESYREDGKPKRRTIMNVGSIKTKEDERRAREILEKLKKGKKLLTLEEFAKNKKTFEYGIIYVCEHLWKRFDIDKIMQDCKKDKKVKFLFEKIIFLLTANRFSDPSSELSALEWIKEEVYVEKKERDEIELHQLYRTLDVLLENKDMIEQKLFKILVKKLNLDTSTVFYDLTSSYFEGTGKDAGNFVLFGYNRDKKKGKRQIVIGLLLIDGIPVYHKVFPGNTTDLTTLKRIVKEIKTKFKLKRIIFVADRGLFTDDNIKWLEEDKENMFILATKRRRHKEMEELMVKEPKKWEVIKLKEDGENKKLFVKEIKKEKGKKYILCLNKERAKEDRKKLKEMKEELKKKLYKLKEKIKKKKRKDLRKSISNILGKKAKFFDIKLKKDDFDYSLNQKVWDYENKICGRYLLVARNNLSTKVIAKKYRELGEIEDAFREIKSFFKVRSNFHKTKERIRGHVFVCMLSFLLSRIAKRDLKDLKMSSRSIFRKLKRLKVNIIKVDGEYVGILDELDGFQRKVLKKLSIREPYPIL